MDRFKLVLLLLFISNLTFGQYTLSGKITDSDQKPIEFTIVSLSSNSETVDYVITDSLGRYEMTELAAGEYSCLFQYVAYADTAITINLTANKKLDLIYEGSLLLDEAVIVAKKPVLTRKIDRISFNVANTDIVFGSSIWEVLRKTPLVEVSNDGDIKINGTSGVTVYINDRKKVLSGEALMNYLSSVPSDNIEAIEVITTPPSRYEAQGGAGVLNIVMKRNEHEGLTGSIVGKTLQATFNSHGGNLSLNSRKGKLNVYADAYISNNTTQRLLDKNIDFGSNNFLVKRQINTIFGSKSKYFGGDLGIDYDVKKNHVIGMLIDFSGSNNVDNRNAISMDNYSTTDSLSITDNTDDGMLKNYSVNLNYQGTLDSTGKKLTVNLDFFDYDSSDESVSKTGLYATDAETLLYTRSWFRSASPQKIKNLSASLDYEWSINDKLYIELGGKTSFSTINNDLLFEDRIDESVWIRDPLRSNLFKYEENIHAVYTSLNYDINDKWEYKLGVRLENTESNGFLEGKQVVDRNYTNIFPTAFLKYSANDESSYVLSLSSRITRPSFWNVNPFRYYTSDNAYLEGNPFLLPSKYFRQELNYTLRNESGTYIFQTGASQLIDEFYALPFNPSENVIANRQINYGNKYAFFESITMRKNFTDWWSLTGNMLAAYIMSKGEYNDIVIDNKTFLLSLSANQSFDISQKAGLSATLVLRNTFPIKIVNTDIGNRLVTELQLRKKMGRFSVGLHFRDMFKSNKDRYKIQVNDILINDINYHDSRGVLLVLRYSFGKLTIKDQRYRDTGNDAEQQRL